MKQDEIQKALDTLTDQTIPKPARLLWIYQWLASYLSDTSRIIPNGPFGSSRSFYTNQSLLNKKNLVKSLPKSAVVSAEKCKTRYRNQQSPTAPISVACKLSKKHRRLAKVESSSTENSTGIASKSGVPRTQGCFTPSSLNKKEDQTCVQKKVGGKTKSGQQKTRPPGSDKMLKWRTMAELLCRTVQDVDGFRYWKHLPKWENQFRAIHVEDGVPTKMLWDILKWYCAQRVAKNGTKLPKCVTANMFRGAFGWIKNCWEKDAGSLNPPDEAWVKAAERSFNEFDFDQTDITLDALSRLYNLIQDWRKAAEANIEKAANLKEFDKHVLFEVLNCRPDGNTLPEQLGEYLYHRITKWSDWGGSLSAFRPGGAEFTAFLQRRGKIVWNERLTTKQLDILLQGACAKKTD
jgi:hypothetical protein